MTTGTLPPSTHEEMGLYHMWLNQVRKNILWSVYTADGTVATLIKVWQLLRHCF